MYRQQGAVEHQDLASRSSLSGSSGEAKLSQPVLELREMLLEHAREASRLVNHLEQLELGLLSFSNAPEATQHLNGLLHLAQRVDGLRHKIVVNELLKVAEWVHEIEHPPSNNAVTQQVAVLLPSQSGSCFGELQADGATE